MHQRADGCKGQLCDGAVCAGAGHGPPRQGVTMQHNCITAMEFCTHRAGNGVLEKGEAARVSQCQEKFPKM